MEKFFEQALLYDFYGELLTEHQQNIYEDAVFNDMSLSEIAEEQGISRQGVHDLIKRCDKTLQDYESKLHLVERFEKAKEKISEIVALTQCEETEDGKACVDDVVIRKHETEETRTQYAGRMKKIYELSQELMKEW